MNKKWTGIFVGTAHDEKITHKAVAAKLGVSEAYVSMVLNGSKTSKRTEARFMQAIEELIAEKTTM